MTRLLQRPETAVVASTLVRRPAPRTLHPWAWWVWALGAAVAAGATRNPLALLLLLAAVTCVVLARRTAAPWAKSVRAYFVLALVVIGIRVFFQVLVGGLRTGHVLFTLPRIDLPSWAASISLGGPVTAEALYATVCDAGRLAAILCCVGAANTLANPRRALKSVPPALYDVSVSVVIALAVAPQLIESAQRVRRAVRLRPSTRGLRTTARIVVAVLEDAVDRSIGLAAGMEARGYGRGRTASDHRHRDLLVMLAGLFATLVGLYCVLVVRGRPLWSVSLLVAGVVVSGLGLRLSGHARTVTRYRPDAWGSPEWIVTALALATAVLAWWLQHAHYATMFPSVSPIEWPPLTLGIVALAALVAAAAVLTPAPPKGEL